MIADNMYTRAATVLGYGGENFSQVEGRSRKGVVRRAWIRKLVDDSPKQLAVWELVGDIANLFDCNERTVRGDFVVLRSQARHEAEDRVRLAFFTVGGREYVWTHEGREKAALRAVRPRDGSLEAYHDAR